MRTRKHELQCTGVNLRTMLLAIPVHSQGNHILIRCVSDENGFEDVVVPAGLESFAADRAF